MKNTIQQLWATPKTSCQNSINHEFIQINKKTAINIINACNNTPWSIDTKISDPIITDPKWKAYFDEENVFLAAKKQLNSVSDNSGLSQKVEDSNGKFSY